MNDRIDEKALTYLIQDIDRDLGGLNVPIHQRAMKAVSEFQRRTGIQEIIFGGELLGLPPTYSQRIFTWYENQYGDRQKIDMSIGASLILIRGEPWKITFPLIFGEIYLNILDLISDLPQNLRQSLTDIEKESILATFKRQEGLVHRIDRAKHLPYIQESRYDIISGVGNVCKAPQNLPMAKWFFSQAAEKSIKCFLKLNGVEAKRDHNLKKHLEIAVELGLPEINDSFINDLYCPGSVRYGEYDVSSFDVMTAHDACWEVIDIVLTKIQSS